jgi:crossover junction endodeoxyribonuclease RusA
MTLTMERRTVTFRVVGTPQPKGSTKAYVPKSWVQAAAAAGTSPRAVVTNDNPRSKTWEQLVRDTAQRAAPATMFMGPILIAIVFRLPRPRSLPKYTAHCTKRPDVDKLARGVLDALTGVYYADDNAVVELRVRKVYARDASPPSACITVMEAAPPQPDQSSLAFGLDTLPLERS